MGPLGASQAPNRARCKGRSGFHEAAQAARAARMTELAQRLRLDLADALARDRKARPDLLERVVRALPDAEAQPQHLLLPRRERGEHLARLILEVQAHHRVRGRGRRLVLDEVADDRVLLLADRRLEGDRLLGDLHDPTHLVGREIHVFADLLRRGLAAHLLHQEARGAHQLVDRLYHVHGDADGARLIGDRARDRLPDPPRGVGRKLVAAPVLELLDRAHESDVALLDEVEELEAAANVPLGDRHDQAEVGLDHLLLGAPGAELGGADVAHRALERAERHADLPLDLGQLAACGTDLLGQRGQRLGRDADRAARALQRDPLAGWAIGALGAVREAARQAEQLGRRAAGALLDGLEVRPPRRRPLEAGMEPARHVLDLAAREPEPAERAQEMRLDAGATLGEPAAPATAMGERARLRIALRGEPPHPPELPEEVPPQAHLLVPRLRLRALLARVAHQVADPDLARAQSLGEREHVAQRVRRPEHGAHQEAFALLDALGDLHLAFACEQL